MGLADALGKTTNVESDSGFERDTSMSGRRVREKYDRQAKHGELSVILATRFEVDVAGDGFDITALERALGSVDLPRLESLKDARGSGR